jgi:hypothetical protein
MSNELGFKEESSNGENVCKENCPPPPIRLALAGLLIVALLSLSAVVAPRVLASDPVTITITDARILEGDGAVITVYASAPIKDALKLVFTTSDGTATVADGDYEAWKHKGRMKKGDRSKSWVVKTARDDRTEGDESFYVNIRFRKGKNYEAPAGYAIADGEAEVVIVDNDDAPQTVRVREPRSAAYLNAEAHSRKLMGSGWPMTTVYWRNDGRFRCVMIKRLDEDGNEYWLTGDPRVKGGCNTSGALRPYHQTNMRRHNDLNVEWGKTYRYTVYTANSFPKKDGTFSYTHFDDASVTTVRY